MAKTKTTKDTFETTVPQFSYSTDGSHITFKVIPVENAEGYEIHKSERARGDYQKILEHKSTVQDYILTTPKTLWYKVRAFKTAPDGTRVFTAYSKAENIDLVAYAKEKATKIDEFFKALKEAGDVLSYEDLDIAIETIKLAGYEQRERELRRKKEREAEKLREQMERETRRRQKAAERAAARKEKKRLEHVESVTRMDLPLDFTNPYDDDDRANAECDSLSQALFMSIDMLGMVDIEFIASVTGKDLRGVIEGLRGSIFQNPLHWNEVFYKGWETADEYLSGNIIHKLKVAKDANAEYNGYFQSNVDALEKLVDADISIEDIYVTLGSPWVPTDIIDDFITYMAFGGNVNSAEAQEYYEHCLSSEYAVKRDDYTGMWEIPKKTRFRTSYCHGKFEEVNYKIYGTDRMDMLYILENTLNMKTISITDLKNPDDEKDKRRIINPQETAKALEKQRYMTDVFKRWVWDDENRKARLQSAYCRKYGNIRKRNFDGSFLELPGLSEDITLYDYQKNAIARIIFSPNTLLAHDVGSGKTFIMIAAGMELRRLEKSKKNLYVIPNNIISQWEETFLKMYPKAKLLVVTNSNFNAKCRNDTLMKIKNEDYDAILMTYSCFDMLSLSDKYYINLNKERLKLLDRAKKTVNARGTIDKKKKSIEAAIEKLHKTYKTPPKIMPFDDLGINTLFVDEAHNYKNVSLESKISRVRGINNTGSPKADGMMDKVHCVQRMNDGGRVVFATGTPVTNSLSDIYIMQRYLQEGELEFQGILTFDAWAAMYAQKTTDFEIDIDTNSYQLVSRFSKFGNLPELTATLSSIADFHKADKTNGIPELEGYSDSTRDGSKDFKNYLRDISKRADDVRNKRVDVKEDNMLKITSDGRKAALDMRLVDEVYGLDQNAKVIRCAENVYDTYMKTRDINGTQLVFSDLSTPKQGFNLYDELKNLLIAMGMPKEKIAFVHDATSETQRKEIFAKMRKGELSVLVGSTAKMGHGMNVQNKLVAIHHLDVPWKPSDMVQREGRILRQGNENEKVQIFRYITKASFDAYSWQLLETKQKFISQIMSGDNVTRTAGDIDDTVLNYGEVKALAVGNPKIKRRVEVKNELDRYLILQADYINQQEKRNQLVNILPKKIEYQKELIEKCQQDIDFYAKNRIEYKTLPEEQKKALREKIYQTVQLNENSDHEVKITNYQGFDVVVPAYMVPSPGRVTENITPGTSSSSRTLISYVHVKRAGCYKMEIESESGIGIRLSNLLDGLEKIKKGYEEELLTLSNRLSAAKEELSKKGNDFTKEITELERELDELNEELGLEL